MKRLFFFAALLIFSLPAVAQPAQPAKTKPTYEQLEAKSAQQDGIIAGLNAALQKAIQQGNDAQNEVINATIAAQQRPVLPLK